MMVGSRGAPPTVPTGRGDTPAALVRRVVEEACNRGCLAALDALLPPCSTDADGRVGLESPPLRAYLAAFRAAAPDARWTIVEQISEGERVVTRLSVAGVFSGPLLGLVPPGRPATLTGVVICRFAEGRLAELWLQADLLGFLQQLGVSPPLDLSRAVTMAQVTHAGALLAAELEPRAPPAGRMHAREQ